MHPRNRTFFNVILLCVLVVVAARTARSQSVASGTVEGTVTDPSGSVIVGAKVDMKNPITGYE